MSDNASKYEEYLQLLDFRDVNPVEAERIAEKCFHAQALLVRDIATAEFKELMVGDNVDIVKSELLLIVPSEFTNAETRKAWVTCQANRKTVSEKHHKTKVAADYLRRLLKLFENAQYYYAGKARR
jgi:hypothetical protein